MTRRGRFSHAVEMITAPTTIAPVQALTLVLCHRREIKLTSRANTETLGELDCAILPSGQSAALSGSGNAFVIRLEALI
jgi:environmental stress-induced protein Ves